MNRDPWPVYFMSLAKTCAKRSTCRRRQVGAVAVDPVSHRVLAMGYNGAPPSVRHCIDTFCFREVNNIPSGQREELCFAVHAEQNLIASAARFGVSLVGTEVYVTHQPCLTCLKLLISAGVSSIVFDSPYPVDSSLYSQIVDQSGIKLKPLSEVLKCE